MAHGESLRGGEGGRLRGDLDATAIGLLQNAEGKRNDALRRYKHPSIGSGDTNGANLPRDAAHDLVEINMPAKVDDFRGEILRELRISAAHMPHSVAFGGVFGGLLRTQAEYPDPFCIRGVEAFNVAQQCGSFLRLHGLCLEKLREGLVGPFVRA